MRWTVAVACGWMAGCVVYRGDRDDFSTGGSTSDSTTTPVHDGPEGDVEIAWRIGATGCEEAGITTVEADLDGIVQAFDCAAEGGTITVAAGRYPLRLTGFDADGIARYAGNGGTVRVDGGELTVAPTVVLSGLPATIDASWRFDNGRLCAPNGVSEVEVVLFDADDTLKDKVRTACDDGRARIDDVEAGTYALVVLGRDDDGEVLYSGEQSLQLGRGDSVDVDVVLVPEG